MKLSSFLKSLVLVSLTTLTGCHGKAKVNSAKMGLVHKVAIVGLCTEDVFPGGAGLSTVLHADWGTAILPSEAAGFEGALPAAWKGVEVVPLSAVVKTENLPKGSGSNTCFGSTQPLTVKHKPDLAVMKQMATMLNVDAVLAVWSGPGVQSGGAHAHINTGTGAVAYLVDKEGELVATTSLNGAESGDIDALLSVGLLKTNVREVTPADFEVLGSTFGVSLAKKLGGGLSAN